jgi:hypothetical protein
MERRVITVNDFYSVARNNDYFLWHFLKKNQSKTSLVLHSYFDKRENRKNDVKEILDLVDIPYFESYTEDSMEFLHGLGLENSWLWSSRKFSRPIEPWDRFSPVLIGFKKFTSVSHTMQSCYCTDGILKVINDLNPEFLLKVNTDD